MQTTTNEQTVQQKLTAILAKAEAYVERVRGQAQSAAYEYDDEACEQFEWDGVADAFGTAEWELRELLHAGAIDGLGFDEMKRVLNEARSRAEANVVRTYHGENA